MNSYKHIPVLYDQVLAHLQAHANGRYIDGTVGAGGHTAGILEVSAPTGRVLAFDKDPEALRFAQTQLTDFGERVMFVHASYAQMGQLAPTFGFTAVDGILLDLGLSSRQLDDPERGFSFMKEGPLDMRFDATTGTMAADLINNLTEVELATIFWEYGEEKKSRRYARLIVDNRPLYTTTALAELLANNTPKRGRIHPATKLFQALRIAVNHELEDVQVGVMAAIDLLKENGRLAVISFHSLEDRFVKNLFRELSKDKMPPPGYPKSAEDRPPLVRLITRKAIQPTATEIEQNYRSRSARLRVIEKI